MNDFSQSSDSKNPTYRGFMSDRDFGPEVDRFCGRIDETLEERVSGADNGRNLILASELVLYVHLRAVEPDKFLRLFGEWAQPDSAFRPYLFAAAILEKNSEASCRPYSQVLELFGDWRSWPASFSLISSRLGLSGSGLVSRIMVKAMQECRLGWRTKLPPLPQGGRQPVGKIQGSERESGIEGQTQREMPLGNPACDSRLWGGPAQDGKIRCKILRQVHTRPDAGGLKGEHSRAFVVFEPASVGILRGRELSFDGSAVLQKVFGPDSGSEAELPVFSMGDTASLEAYEEILARTVQESA